MGCAEFSSEKDRPLELESGLDHLLFAATTLRYKCHVPPQMSATFFALRSLPPPPPNAQEVREGVFRKSRRRTFFQAHTLLYGWLPGEASRGELSFHLTLPFMSLARPPPSSVSAIGAPAFGALDRRRRRSKVVAWSCSPSRSEGSPPLGPSPLSYSGLSAVQTPRPGGGGGKRRRRWRSRW